MIPGFQCPNMYCCPPKAQSSLIGGARVRGLGMRFLRLSWLPDGVWRLLPLLYLCLSLCRSGCLFSLLFFRFFSCSTSPSSLCLCVSIPPSLSQHPPIPLLHLSQVVFALVVISNPACLFLVLKNYERCSISPLTLVCCLRFLS
ncbi:hypothetical protein QQF64_017208 [Cirrhinus molitorella]|uniref:Transmembrane protein n=1 Tax=Cirrhinus molitorella TaxID=172907 RepID=A0ABR3LI40_9TELE